MAGPFDFIFGPPVAEVTERMQQEGANQRAGIAAGTAANALREQQRQFDEKGKIIAAAAQRWNQLLAEQGPGIGGMPPGQFGPPDPAVPAQGPDTQRALQKFVRTQEFMQLPRAGVGYEDMIKALQQNPTALEQFTLGPQQQRFAVGPDGRSRMVAENTNNPPKPYESSVDKARTDILKNVAEGLGPAQTQLQEIEALAAPLLRTGEAFPGGTWRGAAAALGIPVGPRQTDIQVVQSIIDGLTPLQRRGLPGAASDRDMATFRGRLPDLMRTSEGNREILTFLTAQARAAAQAGQIASEAFTQGADPGQALQRAQGVRFSDVLAQTRRDIEDHQARAVEAVTGINVGEISTMTDAQLRNFTTQMATRYPRGIPPGIQRRIMERARDIERDMGR